MDIQLGRSKVVRRAYGIDEIALVPGGRTVDPEVTDTSWSLGGINREIPIIASAMDGVVDVGMAVKLTQLGALGVINLEGVQTRYEDPNTVLERIAAVGKDEFVPLMQEIYSQPVQESLITKRIQDIKAQGGIAAVSGTPWRPCASAKPLRKLVLTFSSCRPRWSPPTTLAPKDRRPSTSRRCAVTWVFRW